MLSSVASTVVQLTPLPLGPDDGPEVIAPPRKRAPSGAEVLAAPADRAAVAAAPDTTAEPATGHLAPDAATTAASSSGQLRAKTSERGYAGGASGTTTDAKGKSSTGKASGALAFLDDPKLSVEEKLLRLLSYLNDKWNKELDQKMKEFKQPASGTASAGTSSAGAGAATKAPSSSSGGLLKKAVGYASKAIPGLGVSLEVMKEPAVRSFTKAVAGPALAAVATYYGQPQLAPIALKLGPELADAAANAASAVTDGDGGSPPSSPSSSGILSGLFSGASSGESSGILSGLTSGFSSGTSSGDSSGILSGLTSSLSSGTSSASSGILSGIFSGGSSASASGSSSSPGASSGAKTQETASGIGSDRDAQLRLMEMQRILDQQKEMFSLVSNMLRSTHETRMAVVQNLR
jgi:hypothetical protein